ncbi:MAG: type II and III secretion system protein family protein [Pseudomonadota bacterium]
MAMRTAFLLKLCGCAVALSLCAPIVAYGQSDKNNQSDLMTYIQGNTNKTRYITVPKNKAAIVKLPRASRDVIVADPELLDVVVRNPREVYLFAKETGLTNAFFFDDQGRQIVNMEINIGLDVKELERIFAEQMPESMIKVSNMGDTIILSGNVKNATYAQIARDIARRLVDSPEKVINNIGITGQEQVMIKVKVAEMQREILKQLGIDWNTAFSVGNLTGGLGLVNGFGANGSPATGLVGSALGTGRLLTNGIGALPNFATSEAAAGYAATLQNDITYLLGLADTAEAQVANLQQQLLDTTNTLDPTATSTLINQLNSDVSRFRTEINQKNAELIQVNNSLASATAVEDGNIALNQRTAGYSDGNINVDSLIRALERHSLIKTLAEPNLTALSGESAKFLAGGELPFLISQTFGQATVDFKPFGIGLAFTPMVLNEGRISLKISTEVSEISGTVTSGNSSFPGLAVRRAETTVEMPSGGSLVMAGLIREDARRSIDSTPGVKDVPILGPLFRSNDFKANESELAVLVSPYLIKPTHEKNLKLPTDGYANPSDLDMYLRGRIAGVYGGKDDDEDWITSLPGKTDENNKTKAMLNSSSDHILE